MVDRAWLARRLRGVRDDSTRFRTFRECADVVANNLPRDVIGIVSRGVQPTEEVREANRVSALRVDRTIARAPLRLETSRTNQRRRFSSHKHGMRRRIVRLFLGPCKST